MANKVVYINSDNEEIVVEPWHFSKHGLMILQQGGDNNLIKIHEGSKFDKVQIIVSGNNNVVIIGKNTVIKSTIIKLDYNKNYRSCWIQDCTTIDGAFITLTIDKDKVQIGKDCMLSYGITIRTQDGHSVYDKSTKKVINRGGSVIIGEHVWIGSHVYIGKNVTIGSNDIVGAGSIVVKPIEEEYVSIAGNPAKIVRRDVGWSRMDIDTFEKNM